MTLTLISPAAVLAAALIADEEGFVSHSYYDADGKVWSIGYGFCTLLDGSPVTAHTPSLTVAECGKLMAAKLDREYMPGVVRAMGVPMTDGQLAALSSFAWNLGVHTLEKSGIPRLGKASAWSGVAAAMQQYVYAGGHVLSGLVGRRKREAAILMGATFIPGMRTGAALGTLHAPPIQQQLHAGTGVVTPPESEADLLNKASLAAIRAGRT